LELEQQLIYRLSCGSAIAQMGARDFMRTLQRRAESMSGFSLADMLMTCAVIGTITAMALPLMNNTVELMKLGMSTRDVERVLQSARLKAVAINQPMRVRFNCPNAGDLRMVELIGTKAVPDAKDSDANRCSETTYPYFAPDRNRLTRPNNDGPIVHLRTGITFRATQTLEFWDDGTVHAVDPVNPNLVPWPALPAAGATMSLAYKSSVKTITVNNVGKILADR
jgi:Tfp pilus assembly protein FimT